MRIAVIRDIELNLEQSLVGNVFLKLEIHY